MTIEERIAQIAKIAYPHLSPYEDFGEIHAEERRMAARCLKIITDLQEENKSWRQLIKTTNQTNESLCGRSLAMIEENQQLKGKLEWQPIETAPKDGANILISDGFGAAVAYNAAGKNWQCSQTCEIFVIKPTHWMPLPKPPIKEQN